jgi:hypothetical protein
VLSSFAANEVIDCKAKALVSPSRPWPAMKWSPQCRDPKQTRLTTFRVTSFVTCSVTVRRRNAQRKRTVLEMRPAYSSPGKTFVGETAMNLLSLVSWLKSDQFFKGFTLVALAGALAGAGKFLLEYSRDNRRKRMEMYVKLREKFRDTKEFDEIFAALDKYAEAKNKTAARKRISAIPFGVRFEFVAFLEDVAMAMNSGTLKPRVANYMFGYYAILCWDVDEFWAGLRESKDDPYWALFKWFVKRLKLRRQILERFPWLVVFWMRV